MSVLEEFTEEDLKNELDRRKKERQYIFEYWGHITQEDLFSLGFKKEPRTITDHWNLIYKQDFVFVRKGIHLFRYHCYLVFEWSNGCSTIQSLNHLKQLIEILERI